MALVEHRRDNTPVRYQDGREEADYGPASMDIRMPLPLRWLAVIFFLVGLGLAYQITEMIGAHAYTAEARVVGIKLENPNPHSVSVNEARMQTLLQLVRSDAYLAELARRAGTNPDLDRLHDMVTAARPRSAAVLVITAHGPEQEEMEAIGQQLIPTLDVMVDKIRNGTVTVLDENGRNPFAGEEASYTGPMYLDPFEGRAEFGEIASPTVVNMAVGGVIGLMVLLVVALGLHARPRVTSDEDLSVILGVPSVGLVPRLGWRLRRGVEHYLKGLALAIDGTNPHGVGSVGLLGNGIPRTRSKLALTVGVAMVATLDRNVVLVDLDIERGSLSRRLGLVKWFGRRRKLGVSDVVSDGLPIEPLVQPVRRRRLPRALRRLSKQAETQLYAVGIGKHLGDIRFEDELAVVEAVRRLTPHAIVLLVLPRVPGPAPVQGVLAELDVSLLTILDGWSPLPDAQAAGAVLSSTVAGRAGFLLLEN